MFSAVDRHELFAELGVPWKWQARPDEEEATILDVYSNTVAFLDGRVMMGEQRRAKAICVAVNEHEALIAVEASLRAVVHALGGRFGVHARDSLGRLDYVRTHTERRS